MTSDDRFRRAAEQFDAANAEDPNREVADGVEWPKEPVYARRMPARLDPVPTRRPAEAIRLATRYQHIRRWTILRTDYFPGFEVAAQAECTPRAGVRRDRRAAGRAPRPRRAASRARAGGRTGSRRSW